MDRFQYTSLRRRDRKSFWGDGPAMRICGATLPKSLSQILRLLFAVLIFTLIILSIVFIPKWFRKWPQDGPSMCLFNVHYSCGSCIPDKPPPLVEDTKPDEPEQWAFDYERDGTSHSLTEEQCDVAFPGLFTEIEESLRSRLGNPITADELDRSGQPDGTVRAMVYNGQLYVIDAVRVANRKHFSRALAALYSLDRALVSFPDARQLPNAEFILSVSDNYDPDMLLWTLSRRARDRTWVYPDFGFYSWPEMFIGSYPETVHRMLDVEKNFTSFYHKIPKLVWRGNVAFSPTLRNDLISSSSGQSWSDVIPLDARRQKSLSKIQLPMEDHCKYMFIAHTEAMSFSGTLKYIQNCQSVIFAHKMQWIQPFHYLMVSSGKKQNYVEVERDFTDLEDKMDYLLENIDEAARIAKNNVRTFRERYLTPAAQACYWRKLIKGWGKISFKPEFYENITSSNPDGSSKPTERKQWRGIPFESYALKQAFGAKFR